MPAVSAGFRASALFDDRLLEEAASDQDEGRDAAAAEALLHDLTGPQRQAVVHRGGPLLVVAGAGSGKTRVLTRRVAHLLATKDAAPFEILAITFTNKAADEMRRRVGDLVGAQAERMWVSTFHSACLRMLRANAERLGYRPSFSVYDETDSRRLVELVTAELGLDAKRLSARQVAAVVSQAKAELVDPEAFAAQAVGEGDPFRRKVADIYAEYQRRLRQANAMDFDDLLMATVTLLRSCPDVLERYQERFRHILVDEFQDTNVAQNEIVIRLGRAHGNVCVVGDADQSIYRWRGAEVRNILEFEAAFEGVTTVALEQNFRSTQIILDVANALIAHNTSRLEKRLWTERTTGAPVVRFRAEDEGEEAAWVGSEILRLATAERLRYGEIAVFYRTNAQSRVLEEQLSLQGVPYKVVGGTRFYDRREVKDVLAYLRVLANPQDEISARRILNVPRRGLGATSVGRLVAFAASRQMPLTKALEHAIDAGLSPQAARSATSLASLLAELLDLSGEVAPAKLVEEVAERTGYLDELVAEGTHEAEGRVENIAELAAAAASFEDLSDMLEAVALVSDADELDDDADRVSLMTLHVAKGLEFEAVFLVGLEDGVFPHLRSLADPQALEEERRLCYVGVTRARRRLALSHAWRRSMWGTTQRNICSRFWSEIPAELCLDVGSPLTVPEASPRARAFSPAASGVAAQSGALLDLEAGEAVVHDRWGRGLVLSVAGSGDRLEAKVRFSVGEKRLLVAVAPLRRP